MIKTVRCLHVWLLPKIILRKRQFVKYVKFRGCMSESGIERLKSLQRSPVRVAPRN